MVSSSSGWTCQKRLIFGEGLEGGNGGGIEVGLGKKSDCELIFFIAALRER